MLQQLRRSAAGGAVCATLALLATGCGGSSNSAGSSNQTPQQELSSAVSSLGNGNELTTTLTVDATKAQLLALNAGEPKSDQIDANTAGLIAGADLVVALHSPNGTTLSQAGKATGTKKPTNVSVRAIADNSDVFELRGVDGALYLRADVAKITSLAGKTQADVEKLKAQVPPQLSFANAALAGKWIGISAGGLKTLSTQLGASATPPSTAKQQQFVAQVQKIVQNDVTVRRVSSSSSDGDRLKLSGNARTVVTDLFHAVTSVAPANPAFSAFDPTSVPTKTVQLDAVVKEGTLDSLSLDLTQFASGKDAQELAGKHLPLQVKFEKKADAITAPSDSTPVDVSALTQLLTALMPKGQ